MYLSASAQWFMPAGQSSLLTVCMSLLEMHRVR